MDLRIPATGNDIKSVSTTYKAGETKTPKAAGGKAGTPETADSVALSPDAEETLEISRAAEARAKELPDVREQLVGTLRGQIQNGEYEVDHEQVAERMLADLANRD